jgi:superfamily II DNA or RNA helicase
MKTPREYQHNAFTRLVDALYFCLNFDCGLGKTFVLCWIAVTRGMPMIVIAPKNLTEQWRDEFIACGVAAEDIFIADKPAETKDPEGYKSTFEKWLRR